MAFQYNNNKPFLVVDTFLLAQPGVKTERKGFGDNAENWQSKEVPYIVERITPKIAQRATVIIDIENNKLIKNRYSGTDSGDVLEHFSNKYAGYISEAKGVIAAKKALAKAST